MSPSRNAAGEASADPLAPFSEPVRRWFEGAFEAPTPAQTGGWEAISGGESALICAPTGSGKTLASFLWGIDRLTRRARARRGRPHRLRLAAEGSLLRHRAKPAGAAARDRRTAAEISVGLRTGDTSQADRRSMRRDPPDILITTPESLYLMLSSGAREILASAEVVIVDEIHAVAQSKRGSHLALTLERLEWLAEKSPHAGREDGHGLQRIGLSATQRPLERIAAVPGRSRTGSAGSSTRAARRRSTSRSSSRSRTCPIRAAAAPRTSPGARPTGCRASTPRLTGSTPTSTAPRTRAASGRRSTRSCSPRPRAHLDDHLRQQPPRRRAPRQAPQRAGQRAGGAGATGDGAGRPRPDPRTSRHGGRCRDRPRPPRLALARGADQRRGAAEVRAAAMPGRDLLAGAGDRHGGARPGDPGRVAEVGDQGPAADRPRRARARRGLQGPDLPQVQGRPARVRGGRQADARGGDRGDGDPGQPARRAGAAPGLDGGARRVGGRRRRAPRHRHRARSASSPASSSRTSSTCSTAAIPRTASPSCARGSSGTAPQARSTGARGRGSWSSPTPGRSPTAASSASICPTAAGSASWTRRWSTRHGPGSRSCSAPRPGGSRRSPATG